MMSNNQKSLGSGYTKVTIEDVQAAAARISVHRTPVLTNETINRIASENAGRPIEIFFKCELLQKTGSFKFRGASNAVQLLTDSDAAKGVVTHSSGNHAQALALAASRRGIPAYVVMPSNSPEVKKAAVRGYDAKVIECEPTLESREATARRVTEETGATFVHPFNNPNVIAGQGTIALELHEQTPQRLDALVVPVGGGGMLTGCSIASKALSPQTRVFAAEPQAVNDAYQSYYGQERIKNAAGARSVADGLLTNLGDTAYHDLQKNIQGVFAVTEQEIIRAMELVWGRMKLCIEPSAAVGVAVILYNKEFHKRCKEDELTRLGVVLCGGNVDVARVGALFGQYLP
ncbi:tryptophan synthase beta subunit-like PLP-dependent enzyme [Fennellomyces sp. T-0311]|nr:tryptophan synthase beta subunit-like PLP-dependent enzyme [Fennellomyces sp. T-0311]